MVSDFPIGSTITLTVPPIGHETTKKFFEATHSVHCTDFLPTLPTVFRQAEFQWLDRLQVDWHKLLHAEQEYTFHAPLPIETSYVVSSKLLNVRIRKTPTGSLTFVELETQITVDSRLRVTALTSFVVRDKT